MGTFFADRRRRAVTGPYRCLVVVDAKDSLVDRRDDRREVTTFKGGVTRATGKQRVAGEQQRRGLECEADAARRVAWRVHRSQSEVSHRVDHVVLEEVIVTRKHRRVLRAYPDVDQIG